MFSIPAFVCATDLSEDSNKALPLAAYLAKRHAAKLVVAHIIDLPAVTPYGETMVDPQELRERVEQSAKAQITDVLANCEEVPWELDISIGYPAKEIQQIVTENRAGMVIAATHTRSGLERLLLGSVTRKLMHTLDVPFLLVPGDMPLNRCQGLKIESILIACDFSAESENAVRWALDMAQAFDSKLILATVIEPTQLSQILNVDPNNEQDLPNKLQMTLKERLINLIPEEDRSWARPEPVILAGKPHEELNKYAILNHVDLIVMGVHGRGFIENLMVGSTTDRLVRLGQFPVMAVRAGIPTKAELRDSQGEKANDNR